jgi:hypothetical protein
MSKQASLNFIAMPPQKIGGINRNNSRSLTLQRDQPKAASNAVAFGGKNRLHGKNVTTLPSITSLSIFIAVSDAAVRRLSLSTRPLALIFGRISRAGMFH